MPKVIVFQPEWERLRELNRSIKNTKKRLITSIMKKVKPLLKESGFVKGGLNDKRDQDGNYIMLKVVWFKKEEGYKLNGTDVIISGFTEEDSIIDDAHGGGLATRSLHDLTIEDLIKVWSWVENDRYKLLTNKKQKQ